MDILSFKPHALLLAALALPVLPACSSTDASPASAPAAAGPTYHEDVEAILQDNCQSCHTPGRIGPMPLDTYDHAKPYAAAIAQQTQDRLMPPWGAEADDTCAPRFGFQHDTRLSQEQIDILTAWAVAGAPEGDPARAPAAKDPPPTDLPDASLELTPDQPFVAVGPDDAFRCFVLDPKLAETKYLNGVHVIAGNPAVVHHALLYLDKAGESRAMADETGSYPCFGGPGLVGADADVDLVGAWAPGGVPTELPDDIGIEIPAGALLVMQVHYHPGGNATSPDSTRVQLRYADAKPKYKLQTALLGNVDHPWEIDHGLDEGPDDPASGVEFKIPAGSKNHTETMRILITAFMPMPLRVYSVAAHMHYIGTKMNIEVKRKHPTADDPANECLLGVPRWDFNWQRFYTYDAPIGDLLTLEPGDQVRLTCTYDNSMDNPAVVRALSVQGLSAPVDVSLGEKTLDEMCLGGFGFLLDNNDEG